MDRVTQKAFRTPMFIAGMVMLTAGMVPAITILISGWDAVPGISVLSAFAPIGAIFMAVARSRASEEWKRGRMTSRRTG